MAIRLHLTAADLAAVRLRPDPGVLAETALAARLVQRHDLPLNLRGWQRDAAGLDHRSWALLELVPPQGLSCSFVSPSALSLEDGLQAMRETPPDEVADELVDVVTGRPSTTVQALAENSAVGWRALESAIRQVHQRLVCRWAPDLAQRRRDDVLARTATLAHDGLSSMLNGLHRRVTLAGNVLAIDAPYEWDVPLSGSGVELVPSCFLLDEVRVLVPEQSGAVRVMYPARQGFPGHPTEAADDPLSALLGRARAAILRAVRDGCGTVELARRTGISPASASAHAAVLREAGLISTSRMGKSVRHAPTPAGAMLISG